MIDEYEFVVQPRLAGHGPTLFAGLSKYIDLRLVGRLELDSGVVPIHIYENWKQQRRRLLESIRDVPEEKQSGRCR